MGQQPFLKLKIKKSDNKLLNADFINKYGLYLPNHAKLNLDDINYICKNLTKIAEPIFF